MYIRVDFQVDTGSIALENTDIVGVDINRDFDRDAIVFDFDTNKSRERCGIDNTHKGEENSSNRNDLHDGKEVSVLGYELRVGVAMRVTASASASEMI